MLLRYSRLSDSNNHIFLCYSENIFPRHFDLCSYCLRRSAALHLSKFLFIISQGENLSWTYIALPRYTQTFFYTFAISKSMSTQNSYKCIHAPYTHRLWSSRRLTTHPFPQQPLRQITVGPASTSPSSQSHTTYPSKPWHNDVKIPRLHLKRHRGKQGSQKHFCLFLIGHPHKIRGEKTFRLPWLTHWPPRRKKRKS